MSSRAKTGLVAQLRLDPHARTGMSQREVAEAMGVSIGTVQRIEYAALAKCRRRMAERGYLSRELLPDHNGDPLPWEQDRTSLA